MKRLKRFVTLAITVILIVSNMNFVHAEVTQDESGYLNSVLNAYLAANCIETDGISISNAIPVQLLENSDKENIYFLKRSCEIIAKLAIIRRDGTYYSCFDMDVKDLNDIYQVDSAIALVKKNAAIFALTESSTITLYKNPNDSVTLSQADINSIKKEKIAFNRNLSQTFQPSNGSEYEQMLPSAEWDNVGLRVLQQC